MTTAAAPIQMARRPAIARDVAMRLARDEYTRFSDQLRQLSPGDWSRSTCCPAWDVHAMACHVVGMAEMAASPVESVRQMRAAKRAGGVFVDALTDLQMRKHLHRSPDELVALAQHVGPKAARGRRRTPGFVRGRAMGMEQPTDNTGEHTEPWTMGYLIDVILTRDTWMHRSDIAAAAGLDMVLTADHDGVLVADVAREWGLRHGQPCTLTLLGPAGGTWSFGAGGPACELDAQEFCRLLSGRGEGDGLLRTQVPF
jgi:uncharacterized protein (TIGR03083 family)